MYRSEQHMSGLSVRRTDTNSLWQPSELTDPCTIAEPMAAQGLPAVMCVAANLQVHFSSTEADRQHSRWDAALRTNPSAQLRMWAIESLVPMLLDLLTMRLRRQARDRNEPAPRGIRLPHPLLDDLALLAELMETSPGSPALLLSFVPSSSDHAAQSRLEQRRQQVLAQLTPSERRVALHVAEGLRNHEIAERIHRSRRTIECQLNAVYRKLDLRGRTELVRLLS